MIENITRGTELATAVEWATTPKSRARGLLGRSGLGEGQALVIAPCNSVHMMFMRFPIDVVFATNDGRVLRAIAALRPWRMTRIHSGAHYAIEMPVGAIARSHTEAGDQLRLPKPL